MWTVVGSQLGRAPGYSGLFEISSQKDGGSFFSSAMTFVNEVVKKDVAGEACHRRNFFPHNCSKTVSYPSATSSYSQSGCSVAQKLALKVTHMLKYRVSKTGMSCLL